MKRIAIFCDGTWNSADQAKDDTPCPTNVVKLALRVAPIGADGVRQVIYYDEGVGTGNVVDRVVGGVSGVGLTDNVIQAYRFLMHNYVLGDAIYLFGFSRGAYTARSLGGMIRKCGILKRTSAGEYLNAIARYKDRERPGDPGPKAFRRAHSVAGDGDIPIEFIGVWDTVGSLGIPLRGLRWITAKQHEFHDVELSGAVRHACHALAIDERRAPFQAARWAFTPHKDWQTIEQVWFAGVHSDVGGGYARGAEPADGWGLSDITLGWMAERASHFGLALDAPVFPFEPNPLASRHDSMGGLYGFTDGIDRAIGLAATPFQQPTESTKELDDTQSIHSSVLMRWDADPSYRPENLRAYFERVGDPRGRS